ncbi:molybdopterin molybdenumtransferase MoeA [Streptomyces inusitatus]|uniref:Molybdopterin molybdenumtransferase n=1 Tax=Streptomyces inusitatus TaxID=68221 RepID=A0A918PNN4_9ACTN|nr:molybdopterin molybdotransferase MoeA [Streptomyces inusitatus]GGZ15920.1 molybdopterin molybdenumtransferase MoeA [Streptomyces inusitatus]
MTATDRPDGTRIRSPRKTAAAKEPARARAKASAAPPGGQDPVVPDGPPAKPPGGRARKAVGPDPAATRAQGSGGSGEPAEDWDADGVAEALALVSGDHRRNGTANGPARSPEGPEKPEKPERHGATAWPEARALAARIGLEARIRTVRVPLEQALGRVLGEPLTALCDLPSFDTSAMDGWAVAGPGPWAVRDGDTILAGRGVPLPLEDGTAVRIATGARIPPEATAVVRGEHARTDEGQRLLHARRAVLQGQDIRPRGQECRSGDRLLPAGTVVTPAVLGLASAAGYDELDIVPRPRVEVLILGDELLTEGLPHEGLIRDALGPMIGPWLTALGAEVIATRRLGDDARALHRAVTASTADLVLTTGGTAAGPVDHVHPVLSRAGAELLIDSVAVRPGHPMLLAALAPRGGTGESRSASRFLVGLPGNPLAAVSGLLTLAEPLLRGLLGLPDRQPYRVPVEGEVHGHPRDTRLVPFVHRDERLLPLRYGGPAMLRGIAAADGLAAVPPGGAGPGGELEVLELPWPPGTPSGAVVRCFT